MGALRADPENTPVVLESTLNNELIRGSAEFDKAPGCDCYLKLVVLPQQKLSTRNNADVTMRFQLRQAADMQLRKSRLADVPIGYPPR